MKSYYLWLIAALVTSCTSQKKNAAYITEADNQALLLDTGVGVKKETIVSGISSGGVDIPVSSVTVIFDPKRSEYVKIEKKMVADNAYNNQFYYKNQKLIKANIHIKNKPDTDYSAVYYLHRNKCIKKVDENPERSDCNTIKSDSETALLDGLPLLPGNHTK
ncbi:MAG: hypothetical protein LBE92_12525 [Chryseobacterium sp.]|jgi:hypothetical protein|uniref:hypothetical protein n=1 Tax=Chryseobacterium sp. TaxID=1871047 RepID=UPI002824F62F|nr:hypothetical protein [Chryseobacterium sp.]MDR2236938.1 hypothetical protein [Chryseobacterium sp.]